MCIGKSRMRSSEAPSNKKDKFLKITLKWLVNGGAFGAPEVHILIRKVLTVLSTNQIVQIQYLPCIIMVT